MGFVAGSEGGVLCGGGFLGCAGLGAALLLFCGDTLLLFIGPALLLFGAAVVVFVPGVVGLGWN